MSPVDPNRPEDPQSPQGYGIDDDVVGDVPAPAAPRRAASAQFVVDSEAGAEATLRAAMNPANQSLAEALRLSYRLLQLVIVALVVLFLFSGFQTVQEGSTGVRTLFGRIYGAEGQKQLSPGFTPFWPYPAGEIVTVPLRRAVELQKEFWPQTRAATFELAVEQASDNTQLRPGIDGSLLSAEGDLAHVRMTAEYTIDDAVDFLGRIEPANADALVTRVLQRSMVHAAASMPLADLVDSRDEPAQAVRERAQQQLKAIGSGLTLLDLRLPTRTQVLPVRKEQPMVQSSREDARALVESAREQAEKTLNGVAGPQYQRLVDRIEEYEIAMSAGDAKASEDALTALRGELEGEGISGEASMIISRAKAYQSQIDATIGNDYRHFESLLPSYLENPSALTRRLWLEAYRDVFGGELVEVISVPSPLGTVHVRIKSDPDVMQDRRRSDLDLKKREADGMSMLGGPYINRGRDQPSKGPGRRLDRDAEGGYGKETSGSSGGSP